MSSEAFTGMKMAGEQVLIVLCFEDMSDVYSECGRVGIKDVLSHVLHGDKTSVDI